METISNPSPAIFLKKSPLLKPVSDIPKSKPVKPRGTAAPKSFSKAAVTSTATQESTVTKPKQSKSRNGCMTCKKKRLKCDETKPSCAQCAKRNVACEGYRKDYKWRSFEEQSFGPKTTVKAKKTSRSSSFETSTAQPQSLPNDASISQGPRLPAGWSPGLSSAFASAAHAFKDEIKQDGPGQDGKRLQQQSSGTYLPPTFEPHPMEFPDGLDPYSLPNTERSSSANDDGSGHSSGSTFSSGSPQLLDLLLPGTDLNKPPDSSEMRPPMSPLPYSPTAFDTPQPFDGIHVDEDFDEEVIRQPLSDPNTTNPQLTREWNFRQPSPAPSEASSTSSKSSSLTILAQPQLDASSPEMLMLRFDKSTCGILSIKDGPTENPWRTLIWPLARDSPALYHAIFAMTAFHGAGEIKQLRVPGMAHMTKSIKKLASEMDNMRLDSALATSLALAFGEGWDRHVSTGIQHLRGARVMVNNALIKHHQDMQLGQLTAQDAMRLKFLCNTFVYMDVIARLTSLEEAGDLKFEQILATANQPIGDLLEIDPLMGCAITLFPIIGRAANHIQHVRRMETNSLAIVSHAMELKEQLQQWEVPSPIMFERPEDVTSEIQHSIQTAEAYRYAMLLYLHQAVPEIPSEPSEFLAKKVLMTLASVPLSSRAIIIQIFPLLAAGCEVTAQEDRQWVRERWNAMLLRLNIGNVVSCINVVEEVWSRRDQFEGEKADRLMRRFQARGIPSGDFVPPSLKPGKRKAHTTETSCEEDFFNRAPDQGGQDTRPSKAARRVTFDSMSSGIPTTGLMPLPSPLPSPGLFRRAGDLVVDQLEPEYTVRGGLHWLGVMQDWDWEVFLG